MNYHIGYAQQPKQRHDAMWFQTLRIDGTQHLIAASKDQEQWTTLTPFPHVHLQPRQRRRLADTFEQRTYVQPQKPEGVLPFAIACNRTWHYPCFDSVQYTKFT